MIKIYALRAFTPAVKGVIRDIRTVWTLEELGIPYERIVMDSKSREHKLPEYLKINPFGKVPTMQDGSFVLFESAAICNYLGDKAAKLIPQAGTKERYVYDQWMAFSISTLEPQCFRVFGFDFFSEKNPVIEKRRAEAVKLVDGFMKVLDDQLAVKPYLLGEDFSIADIMFTVVCRIVKHTEIAEPYTHLSAYLQKNFARPAYKKAEAMNGE